MTKEHTHKVKSGKAGKYTANGFVPAKPQPKKPITWLDILLGRR